MDSPPFQDWGFLGIPTSLLLKVDQNPSSNAPVVTDANHNINFHWPNICESFIVLMPAAHQAMLQMKATQLADLKRIAQSESQAFPAIFPTK
jgi:hypothetical protein